MFSYFWRKFFNKVVKTTLYVSRRTISSFYFWENSCLSSFSDCLTASFGRVVKTLFLVRRLNSEEIFGFCHYSILIKVFRTSSKVFRESCQNCVPHFWRKSLKKMHFSKKNHLLVVYKKAFDTSRAPHGRSTIFDTSHSGVRTQANLQRWKKRHKQKSFSVFESILKRNLIPTYNSTFPQV